VAKATKRSSRLRKKPVELRDPLMAGGEMRGRGPAVDRDAWTMRWLTRLWCAVAEDREWWLPALGLLLVGSGLVVTLVRFLGGDR